MTANVSRPARSAASVGATSSAYADLVAGLLDARADPATERFDGALAAAVTAGELDADLAATLRFWQRAALRSVIEHVRTVLPPTLAALAAARGDALERARADEALLRDPATSSGEPSGDPAPPREEASSLSDRRHRLIVAGLISSTPLDLRAHR
jgi:hypothetical protein